MARHAGPPVARCGRHRIRRALLDIWRPGLPRRPDRKASAGTRGHERNTGCDLSRPVAGRDRRPPGDPEGWRRVSATRSVLSAGQAGADPGERAAGCAPYPARPGRDLPASTARVLFCEDCDGSAPEVAPPDPGPWKIWHTCCTRLAPPAPLRVSRSRTGRWSICWSRCVASPASRRTTRCSR